MKTANFTLHLWGLFILGLPMETCQWSSVGFTTDMRSACAWIYSSG